MWEWGEGEHFVGSFNLTPPLHAFERFNPHLAKDYRHRTTITPSVTDVSMHRPAASHSHLRKVTPEQVKPLLLEGRSQLDIARELGVHNATISGIAIKLGLGGRPNQRMQVVRGKQTR